MRELAGNFYQVPLMFEHHVKKYVNVRSCERMRLSFPVSHRDLSKQDGTRTKVAHDRECRISRDLSRQSAVLSLPAVLLRNVLLLRRGLEVWSEGPENDSGHYPYVLPLLWHSRKISALSVAEQCFSFCYPHHPTKLLSLNWGNFSKSTLHFLLENFFLCYSYCITCNQS